MLRILTPAQCRYILLQNYIGRIGCSANDKVLILPVTYIFTDDCIYSYSLPGEKINMMRINPHVCFEVDQIESLVSWKTIVVNGQYEELNNQKTNLKVQTLFEDRLGPLPKGETLHPSREFADPPRRVQKNQKPILYKIRIASLSGRFESHH
jgi:uncharacterized protein